MPDSPPPSRPPASGPLRWAYLLLAAVSLAAGLVGLFLPIIPTVPFVLLAAWAAARSSPRLLHWLETHRHFGQHVADWRRGGVVQRRAKWLASGLMGLSAVTMLLLLGPRWFVVVPIAAMAAVSIWLWCRPESLPGQGAAPESSRRNPSSSSTGTPSS